MCRRLLSRVLAGDAALADMVQRMKVEAGRVTYVVESRVT